MLFDSARAVLDLFLVICNLAYSTARRRTMRYEHDSSRGQAQDPLVWERVVDGRYFFEVSEGGLHATLNSPHGTSLTLPMIAWEGLLDALSAARKTRAREERSFPVRSGSRWYDGETDELATAFKAGRTIPQLARAHNRSEFAVEAQLDRMGLWDRVARRPKAHHVVPSEPLDGPAQAPE
jgi:hypothetical protein